MSPIENTSKIPFSTTQFCVFVFLAPLLLLTLICAFLLGNTLPASGILNDFWANPYLVYRYVIVNAIPLYCLWGLLYLFLHRPIFSALLASLLACIVVLISNLKFAYLNQPLAASDFLLLNQMVRNRYLFLQYLPPPFSLVLVTAGCLLAFALASRFLECPFPQHPVPRIGMAITGCILIYFSSPVLLKNNSLLGRYYDNLKVTFYEWSPYESVRESGLFFSLKKQSNDLFYAVPTNMFVAESAIEPYIDNYLTSYAGASPHGEATLPDIIVVLSEGFFDLRELEIAMESPVYERWDSLRTQSIRGFLRVETRAGNTPKTEFSFLTGIPFEFIYGGGEYPYYSIVRRPMHSLPRYLGSLGYTTVAVHPNSRTFWNRNIAYPFLGFDKFIDLADFVNPAYIGWYVSDDSVTESVIDTLEKATDPVFIFAVTIENHGPWDKDRGVIAGGLEASISGDLAKFSLAQYMFHLSHAVDMTKQLLEYLENRQRPSVFLIYGDHVPGLRHIFPELQEKVGTLDDILDRTPFMLWRSWTPVEYETNIHVSYLPSLIVETADLVGDRFLAANGVMRQLYGESVQYVDGVDETVLDSYKSMAFRILRGRSDK